LGPSKAHATQVVVFAWELLQRVEYGQSALQARVGQEELAGLALGARNTHMREWARIPLDTSTRQERTYMEHASAVGPWASSPSQNGGPSPSA